MSPANLPLPLVGWAPAGLALADLPPAPGAYLLFLRLAAPCSITAGRLGAHRLLAGVYAYAGSAHGPGGLRARLGRHFHGNGRPHWHIDALRPQAEVLGGYYLILPRTTRPEKPLECRWSQALTRLPSASISLRGFGASDCRAGCPAHLVRLGETLPPEVHALSLADWGCILGD